jgi:hypothetical protein
VFSGGLLISGVCRDHRDGGVMSETLNWKQLIGTAQN